MTEKATEAAGVETYPTARQRLDLISRAVCARAREAVFLSEFAT